MRAILRIILAFTFSLHGYRLLFGFFALTGRLTRQQRRGMAIDSLPHIAGLVIIVGGVLLFLGLFTRVTALILSIGPAVTYLTVAAPRGPWSITNGGQETILYLFAFLYFAAAGAGAWSLDYYLLQRRRAYQRKPAAVAIQTT